MKQSRRRWLKFALAAGGAAVLLGSWWVAHSPRRPARLLRMLFSDIWRRPAAPAEVPAPGRWSDQEWTLAWLGHATVLMNCHGVRVLADPVFSAKVGPATGLGTIGPKRYIAPALLPAQLPPVDVILLSHAHYDHLDLPSLRRLPPTAQVVTAADTADLLRGLTFAGVTELAWNQTTRLKTSRGELEVRAVEVRHWGRRWPSEKARGYNGYILRREGRAVLFGGDTAMTPLFREHRRFGPFDLAIMPIAAYQPWIWNHCTPEEAVAMANDAGAQYIAPVHHETFKLSDEPMDEPVARFTQALAAEPERIAWRKVGQTFRLT